MGLSQMTTNTQRDRDEQYRDIVKEKRLFVYVHNCDGWFYLGISPERFCCIYSNPESRYNYSGYLYPVRHGMRDLLI